MTNYRRPDVYVEEKQSFPLSIQEIETAIPAFIGYTETNAGETKQINDLKEFEDEFGKAHLMKAGITSLTLSNGAIKVEPQSITPEYLLYYAMKHYFDHGGKKCFVVSCGAYSDPIEKEKLSEGFEKAIDIEEVTLLVCPELVKLAVVDLVPAPPTIDYSACHEVVSRTATRILDRENQKLAKFFILDVVDELPDVKANMDEFDKGPFAGLAIEDAGSHMAFYYPYFLTTYRAAFTNDYLYDAAPAGLNLKVKDSEGNDKTIKQLNEGPKQLDKGIAKRYITEVEKNLPRVLLPPSAAMAGLYVKVDNVRGVWKSPANVSVTSTFKMNKTINDALHADLNIRTDNQRSICAIRDIQGYGTRVMGGRTLNGSSNDWRYISVRRFVSATEKSIKNALKQYLFEPNNPTTWGLVKGGISVYLTRKWQEGALLGAVAEDSFFVNVGLGTTMKQDDLLNGRLIVEVGLAVVRPAEFIILYFEQFLPSQLS